MIFAVVVVGSCLGKCECVLLVGINPVRVERWQASIRRLIRRNSMGLSAIVSPCHRIIGSYLHCQVEGLNPQFAGVTCEHKGWASKMLTGVPLVVVPGGRV